MMTDEVIETLTNTSIAPLTNTSIEPLTNESIPPEVILPSYFKEPSSLIVVNIVANSIALFSAALLCYIVLRRCLRFPPFFTWLLFSLSIADLVAVLTLLVRAVVALAADIPNTPCTPEPLCIVIAAFISIATVSSFLWTLVIGVCCTMTLLGKMRLTRSLFTKKALLNSVCWGGAVVVAGSALLRGALGRTHTKLTSTCWVRTCDEVSSCAEQFTWMLFTGRMWEVLSFFTIANVIFVGLCARIRTPEEEDEFSWAVTESSALLAVNSSHRVEREEMEREEKEESLQVVEEAPEILDIRDVKLFLWIPVGFLLCRLWGTLHFSLDVYYMFHTENPSHFILSIVSALEYMQIIGDGAQATCNLLLLLAFCPEARRCVRVNGGSAAVASPDSDASASVPEQTHVVTVINEDSPKKRQRSYSETVTATDSGIASGSSRCTQRSSGSGEPGCQISATP